MSSALTDIVIFHTDCSSFLSRHNIKIKRVNLHTDFAIQFYISFFHGNFLIY